MAQRPDYTKVTGNTYTAANWREIAEKCNQPGKTVSFNETVPYDDEYIMSTPHTQSGELDFIKGNAPTFGDGRGNGVLYLITSDGNDWNFTTDFGNFSGDLALTDGAATPINGTTYRLVCVWNGTTFEVAINEAQINTGPAPPTLTSATIEILTDSVLDLVFNEAVTITTAGWNIDTDGAALSISSVLSGSGTTTPKFQLSRSVLNTETLNVDYDSGTGATVSTATGVELVTFTDTAVINNVWVPSLLGAALALEYNAKVSTTGNPTVTALDDTGNTGTYDLSAVGTPQFNGVETISFNGTTDYLERDTDANTMKGLLGTTEGEIILLAARPSDVLARHWAITEGSAVTDYSNIAHRPTSLSSVIEFQLQTTAISGPILRTNDSFNDTNFHRIFMSSDSSAYKMHIDGSDRAFTVVQGTDNGMWFDDMTETVDAFRLASERLNSTNFFFESDIKYAAFINRQLTTQERSDFDTWLQTL